LLAGAAPPSSLINWHDPVRVLCPSQRCVFSDAHHKINLRTPTRDAQGCPGQDALKRSYYPRVHRSRPNTARDGLAYRQLSASGSTWIYGRCETLASPAFISRHQYSRFHASMHRCTCLTYLSTPVRSPMERGRNCKGMTPASLH
jgi:hypothetical protein